MEKILVKELKIGDRVVKLDASWLDTPFLKHNFVVKDQKTIDKLIKSGIDYVYIEKRKVDAQKSEEKTFAEEILEHKKENISKEYLEIKDLKPSFELYEKSVSIVKNVMEDVRSGKMFDSSSVKILADKIADITVKNKSLLVNIAKLKTYDDYTFQHSLNVAIFASSLGKLLNLSVSEIKVLVNSGILHDIGKMLVPKDILNKPAKLTDEEFAIMKNHVLAGYDFLKKNGFSEEELKIVLEHHERADGSGYPYGLKDEQISIAGKIGAVVDIYDAITSDRVYHKGMYPPKAIKLMFSWTDKHINRKIFEFFVSNVGIYPVGTIVLLSTNELAVVGDVSKKPTEPVVVIFKSHTGHNIAPITYDLSKPTVLKKKIVGPVNPENISVPDEVYTVIEGLNEE
ncbi:HD-GYP domain-containing protein [Deferribacterales bacterium Es71-Z0220]|jgi:putative nucleotidyltransferase with HDIG domain|uniref:HD-GYP domain-containing protein n=1 Tax=Deferrivibrio essentukiensis TaxID=2880922 RepID=UPI001F5FFEF3|nr:HD-GYP domain-containing protein [Deferrivibrio essentukiensis]MCB4204295.1 HD-GYP domain-containing protein [Deferrivibrio essentukiensis]